MIYVNACFQTKLRPPHEELKMNFAVLLVRVVQERVGCDAGFNEIHALGILRF